MNLPQSINQLPNRPGSDVPSFDNTYTGPRRTSPRSDPRAQSNQPPDWGGDRMRFHEALLEQLGGDPYQEDPEDMVQFWNKRHSGDYFDKFFKGRASKQDWKFLPKSYRKAWNKEVRRKHAFIRNKAKKDIAAKVKKYEAMMGRFTKEQGLKKKEHEAVAKKNKGMTDKQTADAMDKARTNWNAAVKKQPAIFDDPSGSGKGRDWELGVDRMDEKNFNKHNKYRGLRGLNPLVETEDKETGNWNYEEAQGGQSQQPRGPKKGQRRASKEALWRLSQNRDLAPLFEKQYGYLPEGY